MVNEELLSVRVVTCVYRAVLFILVTFFPEAITILCRILFEIYSYSNSTNLILYFNFPGVQQKRVYSHPYHLKNHGSVI